MKSRQILTLSTSIGFLVLVSACTSTDPVRVEQDFGNSVRHMVSSQLYDPAAALNPAVEPPTEFDGNKGEGVLESYRNDVAQPKQVERPIAINIDQ